MLQALRCRVRTRGEEPWSAVGQHYNSPTEHLATRLRSATDRVNPRDWMHVGNPRDIASAMSLGSACIGSMFARALDLARVNANDFRTVASDSARAYHFFDTVCAACESADTRIDTSAPVPPQRGGSSIQRGAAIARSSSDAISALVGGSTSMIPSKIHSISSRTQSLPA